ncbi:DUF5085 family protein [Streptococcus panodentis]|uniref:DUF5085 domain-containing protein n=1 Tax=Streptococcus panodentis TaxID=1581472 RepID=A0ABS5B0E1_9STRE|nr:DUF5085 family protein [Streptococcus panodentis]MBP2622284.1 DUF5085 domain-containing protein [Streptococcus panodentis]
MKLPVDVVKVEKIAFQNVVRKRASFHYSEMDKHLSQFVSELTEAGYQLKGPFFYSLNNVPLNEIVDIEMFMPISNNAFHLEGYKFSTYFEVRDLLKTVVKGDFSAMTEVGFAKLVLSLEENDLEIATPFYHIVPQDGLRYLELLVGYY